MFENIDYDELVSKYDNETKLDIAAWVISKIDEHGKNPGSFRYLIYDRLGFDFDAYVPLYLAGGMNITNELDYSYRENIAEVVKKQNLDNKELKSALLICDEPECYNYANCGFPIDDGGYRRTCHNHSHFKTNKPET